VVGVLLGVMTVVACHWQTEPRVPLPPAFFVPAGARNVDHRQAEDFEQVTYCELTRHLQMQQWRGLRQDPFNPEYASDLIRGWHDFTDGTRQPDRQIHAWMAHWRNADGVC
jgi:hypothetical protein